MTGHKFISSKSLWAAAILGVALTACGEKPASESEAPQSVSADPETSYIEGAVFYRERIMLPPGAEVEVQLEDISRADAPATVLATVTMTPEGGPPFDFSIAYDPADIDERMRYALRARITEGDQLRFTNTEYIDPFSGNPVKVMVQAVAASPEPSGPALEGTTWVLATLEGSPAPLGAGDNPVELELNAEEQQAGGFSGCNRYTGSYIQEGASPMGTPLSFGPMASTMKACMDGEALEQQYLKALGTVSAYRLEDGNLVLVAGGEVVATFTAR